MKDLHKQQIKPNNPPNEPVNLAMQNSLKPQQILGKYRKPHFFSFSINNSAL